MLTDRIRPARATWLCLMLSFVLAQASTPLTNRPPAPPRGIFHVATPHELVRAMLWLADVGKTDVVYDLGSGDGRIPIAAVRDFGARKAVGIEIDPELVAVSQSNAIKAGVTQQVKFIHGDLFTNDFSEATVVVLYLSRQANLELRPKLVQSLKPSTRVVSHQFGMGEWPPHKEFRIRVPFLGMYGKVGNPFDRCEDVPDYELEFGFPEVNGVWLWIVPAKIAGVWHGKVSMAGREHHLKLKLYQTLARVTGEFELSGTNSIKGRLRCSLLGNQFNCVGHKDLSAFPVFAFDGHINGDELDGVLTFHSEGPRNLEKPQGPLYAPPNSASAQCKFRARRGPGDYTGLWQWPDPTTQRLPRICIEKHNGGVTAKYTDGENTLPITDFYDFGGGFYFTLRIPWMYEFQPPSELGHLGESLGKEKGYAWLVAHATLEAGALKGELGFYRRPAKLFGGTATGERHEWRPTRLE